MLRMIPASCHCQGAFFAKGGFFVSRGEYYMEVQHMLLIQQKNITFFAKRG